MGVGSGKDSAFRVNGDVWEVWRLIGFGSFGHVTAVFNTAEKKLYAQKTMLLEKIITEKQWDLVLCEKEILSTIPKLRFVCNMHFAYKTNDSLHIVLDMLEGGTLQLYTEKEKRKREMGGKGLSERKAMYYLACTILGLEGLHSHGVVHRDIKDENILLDSEGIPHITDFNVSCILKEGEKRRDLAGTLPYMSPEVLEGNPYDFATDVWSLGVMYYRLLTAHYPYAFGDMNTVAWRGSMDQTTTKKSQGDRTRMLQKVLEGCKYPVYMSKDSVNLLQSIFKPAKIRATLTELKANSLFKGLDFDKLAAGEIPPPFKPSAGAHLSDATLGDAVLGHEVGRVKKIVNAEEVEKYNNTVFKDWNWIRGGGELDVRPGKKDKEKKGKKK